MVKYKKYLLYLLLVIVQFNVSATNTFIIRNANEGRGSKFFIELGYYHPAQVGYSLNMVKSKYTINDVKHWSKLNLKYSMADIAKKENISTALVCKLFKKFGYKANTSLKRKIKYTINDVKRWVKLNKTKSITQIIKEEKVSKYTIYRLFKKFGCNPNSLSRSYNKYTIIDIKRWAELNKIKSIKDIANDEKVTEKTVSRLLKKNGYTPNLSFRKRECKYVINDVEYWIELNKHKTINTISKEEKVNPKTIFRLFKKLGYKANHIKNNKYTIKDIERWYELYNSKTIEEIAKVENVNGNTIRRLFKKFDKNIEIKKYSKKDAEYWKELNYNFGLTLFQINEKTRVSVYIIKKWFKIIGYNVKKNALIKNSTEKGG